MKQYSWMMVIERSELPSNIFISLSSSYEKNENDIYVGTNGGLAVINSEILQIQ